MKSYRSSTIVALVLPGLIAISTVTQALALPAPNLYSKSEVCSGNNTCVTDEQQTYPPVPIAQTNSSGSWQSTSELNGSTITTTIQADAKSEASYGALKGYASATLNDARTSTYTYASAAAFQAFSDDTITITNPTGPQTGLFNASLSLSGKIISSPAFAAPYDIGGIDYLVRHSWTDSNGFPGSTLLVQYEGAMGEISESFFVQLPYTSGEPFNLEIRLGGAIWIGDTSAFPDPYSFSGEVDFFNTATLLGVTLTDEAGNLLPDAVITAASGFNYVVPIPAAAWLFGTGLLGLIGMSRRKKAG